MIPKQFACLIREQCGNTYKLFAIAAGVCFASSLGTYVYSLRVDTITRLDAEIFSGLPIAGIHLGHWLWILFLLFAYSDNDDLQLSTPRYLLRLPVPAWLLVSSRFIFGLISVLVLALASTLLYYALFEARMENELPFRKFLIIYPTLYALLQAAAWCIGPSGITTSIAAIMFGSILPNGIFFEFWFSPFDDRHYSTLGATITVILSALTTWLVVAQHRKGRFAFLESLSDYIPRLRRRPDAPSFTTKEEALRWYEYRRQLHIYPRLILSSFAALLLLHFFWYPPGKFDWSEIPLKYLLDAYYAERVFFAFYHSLAFAALLTGGLFLFQNLRAVSSKSRMFVFIRPVSVKTLATSRFESSTKAIIAGLLPVTLFVVIALFVDIRQGPYNPEEGHPDWGSTASHLTTQYPIYLAVLMSVAALGSLFAATWVGVWSGSTLAIAAVFAAVALPLESIPALREIPDVLRANYAYRITALIVFLALSGLFVVAFRRGLVNIKRFLLALALSPVFGIGLFLYLNEAQIRQAEPLDVSDLTTIVPVFMLAILAPLVATPLITQWARHR